MAAPARRLSTKQLIKFLDIDDNLGDFVDVHAGNEANLSALFDRIAELKEKSPADYERLNAVAAGIDNPDDMVEAIGQEIYPPVASDGIRGKDRAAAPETNERVGAPTDKSDEKALAPVPTPKAPASEAAPAAKRSRGRPRKNAEAKPDVPPPTPAPEVAAPAAATLGPTDSASFVAKASNPEVSVFDSNRAAPTFSMDTLPGAAAAADPFGVGLEAMLAGKFANPEAGIDASMLGSTPMRNVMPPVPMDFSKYGATATPAPGSAQNSAYNPFLMGSQTPTKPSPPTDPLAGLLASDFDYIPDMGGAQAPPPAPGLQPNDFDYVPDMGAAPPPGLQPNDIDYVFDLPPSPPPGLSPNDIDYIPQPETGGSSPMPKDSAEGPWQPTNSMAANFFKAMGLPGGERFLTVATAPIDSSLDFMANHPKLTAAGLVGAGLGMTRLNQAPPNPNAVSPEQAAQDEQERLAARQRLAEQSRRGAPAVIPER